MFNKSFTIACIASIALCDEHSKTKMAEATAGLAQVDSQVQTLGLAQIMAKSKVMAETGAKNDSAGHHTDVDETLALDAPAMLLAQVEQSGGHTCHSA